MTTPHELAQKICNTAVKIGISPTTLLADEIPIITSEWPFILVPAWCPTDMKEWLFKHCVFDDINSPGYCVFPDETTFAMFLFKFPGVIPSTLWFQPLDINDNE